MRHSWLNTKLFSGGSWHVNDLKKIIVVTGAEKISKSFEHSWLKRCKGAGSRIWILYQKIHWKIYTWICDKNMGSVPSTLRKIKLFIITSQNSYFSFGYHKSIIIQTKENNMSQQSHNRHLQIKLLAPYKIQNNLETYYIKLIVNQGCWVHEFP